MFGDQHDLLIGLSQDRIAGTWESSSLVILLVLLKPNLAQDAETRGKKRAQCLVNASAVMALRAKKGREKQQTLREGAQGLNQAEQ